MQSSKRSLKHLVYLAILVNAACSPQGGGGTSDSNAQSPISQKPIPGEGQIAQGLINGKAWEYKQGRAQKVQQNGRRFYEIQLWNEVFEDPCLPRLRGSTLQVRLQAESLEGDWEVSDYPFIIYPKVVMSDFSKRLEPYNNMVASQGAFQLRKDSVAQQVYGSLDAEFPTDILGETWVRGEFVVTLCPQD